VQAQSLPVVLILASGRGERFLASGGTCHKLQADLGGKTVLQRTLDAVSNSGLRWHLEDAGHPGMGDSIAAAVRATSDAPGWMILPADLALISSQTLQKIAAAQTDADVLFPVYEGQRGHPVRFGRACRDALQRLHGPGGASAVATAFPQATLDVNDAGCVLDIDTVGDLQKALAYLQVNHSSGA
jgi:molybdenum cofactor cytidylyltransferase